MSSPKFLLMILVITMQSGCNRDMADRGRYKPYETSTFFPQETSAVPLPEGVVARGTLEREAIQSHPAAITMEVLQRGRDRYNIYCTPCHDITGSGQGMVVVHGFRTTPPSFHIDRLRQAPPEHFYDVITNGFGAMYDYAAEIEPADRWAIAAYIRALQLSQSMPVQALTDAQRQELSKVTP